MLPGSATIKWLFFAAAVKVDLSFDVLVNKAKHLLVSKGEDPDGPDSEVAFESLKDLGRVIQLQAETIKEERSLGIKCFLNYVSTLMIIWETSGMIKY